MIFRAPATSEEFLAFCAGYVVVSWLAHFFVFHCRLGGFTFGSRSNRFSNGIHTSMCCAGCLPYFLFICFFVHFGYGLIAWSISCDMYMGMGFQTFLGWLIFLTYFLAMRSASILLMSLFMSIIILF